MKKSILVLFTLTFSVVSLFAQEPVSTTSSQDSIVFDKLVHDYGTITQGDNGTCNFTFTNNGISPLVLSNVRASCGCTIPEWPKEPIAAGASGIIKVKYDTNRVGSFSKSITVSSNAVNSSVVLRITGNVSQKAEN